MSTLLHTLSTFLRPDQIKSREIDRYAFASDASFYYLVPQVVVQPETDAEIQRLFQVSQESKLPLVFRAAGTSLSGQAITDGILVDISRHWRSVKPEQNGDTVRVQGGVIGGHVNIALRKFGRKIGPDPASINAAMIGGILSNNSSGMCCGVAQNAYHTIRHIAFILPNGLHFSTENPEDYARFATEASNIHDGIAAIRDEIRADEALNARIRAKYKVKNTVGYGLNAFLDYEHPLDIFAHVLIGAEGTLAFISEAVLNTVPDLPFKKTGLLFFADAIQACASIHALRDSGAEALEFMDRAALRSIEHLDGAPPELKTLSETASTILCEYQAETQEKLSQKYEAAKPILETLPLLNAPEFTEDATKQAKIWKLRKGMHASVSAKRNDGEIIILEDITFPVERLGYAIQDIQKLCKQHGYSNVIIFGHAKDGNLHFLAPQSFEQEALERFGLFMEDLFKMVIEKYDGALKAEHGTGRNVAPFVEMEWGAKAYSLMKRLKDLCDPENLLNPDVIINGDPKAHLKHMKSLPKVESEVDSCIECGFCETRCPSRDFTLTPRQRIGLRRALQRLKSEGNTSTYNTILKEYTFDGLETCAVDGMCAVDCPVSINTGELVKRLRRENHSENQNKMANRLAKNFGLLEKPARLALRSGNLMNGILGQNTMPKFTQFLHGFSDNLPMWSKHLTKPPKRIVNEPNAPDAVYFATCVVRMLGSNGDPNKPSIMESFLNVAKKANLNLLIPKDLSSYCCSQMFSSKGFLEAQKISANSTIEALWKWTNEGKLPVVLDVTSCTNTLQHTKPYLSAENQAKFDQLVILDSIEFLANTILPRLHITKRKSKIVLHPVCTLFKTGGTATLEALAAQCADEVILPAFAGCCGMAGDRGFYYPELTQSAAAREATEVKQHEANGYYSSAKSCEISMSDAVGKNYESLVFLVDEVSE
jgi:D-lactate dehydrogenase